MPDEYSVSWEGELIGSFVATYADYPRTLGRWHPANESTATRFIEAVAVSTVPVTVKIELLGGNWLVNQLVRTGDNEVGAKTYEMVLSPALPSA